MFYLSDIHKNTPKSNSFQNPSLAGVGQTDSMSERKSTVGYGYGVKVSADGFIEIHQGDAPPLFFT